MIKKHYYILIFLLTFILKSGISQDSLQIVINSKDTIFVGDTANLDYELILSADKGNLKKAAALLKHGIKADSKTYGGVTPLMFAAQNGDTMMVKLLLEFDAKIDLLPDNGISALTTATQSGLEYMVDFLIQKGANPDIVSSDSISPLLYSSLYGDYIITDMLLYFNANVNHTDKYGNTPLMTACAGGNYDVIELILQSGANINHLDKKSFTPLMIAVQNEDTAVVKLLINNGADIMKKNYKGYTALAIAIKKKNYDIVELLIENGANINDRLRDNKNMVSLSYKYNNKKIRKLLIKNGAKRFYGPKYENTSLGFDYNWNFNDYMMGAHLSYNESRYKTSLSFGYNTRPWANRILVEIEENYYHQYWETRSFFYLSLVKRIPFNFSDDKTETGIAFGLKEIYTYGNYRGSDSKPDDKFRTVPQIGLYARGKDVGINLYYEYMDFHTHKTSAHRINIGLLVFFNSVKDKNIDKLIEWY